MTDSGNKLTPELEAWLRAELAAHERDGLTSATFGVAFLTDVLAELSREREAREAEAAEAESLRGVENALFNEQARVRELEARWERAREILIEDYGDDEVACEIEALAGLPERNDA